MNMLELLLNRRRLILTAAILMALSGFMAWQTMVRQEDPRLPEYWGQIVVPFPGAEAEQVERLVVEPIEDRLAEIPEISWVESTAYAEMAVVFIEQLQEGQNPDDVWDDVRAALTAAAPELPAGAGTPMLNDEVSGEQESVVLAVTGSADLLVLLDAARRLERELLAAPEVAKVHIVADPGEMVSVDLDPAIAHGLGLSREAVVAQLASRSKILAGGSVKIGDRTLRLRPLSEFLSVDEIAATPLVLGNGGSVPLAEVARVRLGPSEPASARMRFNGELAVGVGVVAKKGTDLLAYGDAVRDRVSRVAPELSPLTISEVAFQPRRVAARLDQLGRSLLLGMMIVAGVVVLAMGLRLGLLVASVIPMVALASLAVYGLAGGVLHQISIAALVLALGMLVDNAIVMAENIKWRIDRGVERAQAAREAVRELAVPLGAATATTLAAFVPMLLADGATAAFTRAIPIVIMLTLTVSYLFAVTVTPVLSSLVLTPSPPKVGLGDSLARRLAKLATGRPLQVLVAATVIVGLSLAVSGSVRRQFFPAADRNQVVVDLRLAEGAHLDATDRASRVVERALLKHDAVLQVTAFLGRSAPKFYYNLPRVPFSPHFAQLVVETATIDDVAAVIEATRRVVEEQLPGVECVPRRLQQGPQMNAPVEIRLYGRHLEDLAIAAGQVKDLVKRVEGTVNVRHNLGPGAPTVRFRIDDAAAARYGLTRVDVARALVGQTRGLPVGELRSGPDAIPIVVRAPAGEATQVEDLETVLVTASDGRQVPLSQVASLEPAWRPAAIKHRDRQRLVTVSSQLADGATFSEVMAAIMPGLEALAIPAGIEIGFGGEAEGSEEANTAMLSTLPIGLLLLLGVLLAEFNSFRRVAIILVTVPLAAAGVVPGLLISGQPFGFMSSLGVIALVGIVVNNAIVLLEVVESRRRAGATLEQALTDAIVLRLRPILLTTATTVAGLLPLALSPSTLWPPLASAMISGLLASTLLTLLVVPALYRILLGRERVEVAVPVASLASAAAVVVAMLTVAGTEALTLEQSMQRALDRPAAAAASAGAQAAREVARSERRSSLLPALGVSFTASDRNRNQVLSTPVGEFEFNPSRANSGGVELRQPLFDASAWLYDNPASHAEAEAAGFNARRRRQELVAEAAAAHLEVLAVAATLDSTEVYVISLRARLDEVLAMVEAGRGLASDALKIRLALDRAELELLALQEAEQVKGAALALAVGADEEVEAEPAPDWLARSAPNLAEAVERALAGRADLGALASEGHALELRQGAIRAELLPRLDARLGWTWTDGSPYTHDNWTEGALTVSWTIFAAGTRAPRRAAIKAQQSIVEHQSTEVERAVALEVQSGLARLRTAREAVLVSERGVEQATEALRVERERHHAGRSTTNDLLDAEAALREQRTAVELAQLEVVAAWVELWLASGEDDPGVLFRVH